MIKNINTRKNLENDSIQKSGKKDMVVKVPGKAGGYNHKCYTSDLQASSPAQKRHKTKLLTKRMDWRKKTNVLALVLQIQIQILSIASTIGLKNKLFSIHRFSLDQHENAKTREMLPLPKEFSNSGSNQPEHTNNCITLYNVIKCTVYHCTV